MATHGTADPAEKAPIEEAEVVTDAPGKAGADADRPAPTAEPAPVPPPPPAAPTVVRRGPGFVPLLLGGAVAAGIGYGAAQVMPRGWPLLPPPADPATPRVAALEDQVARLSAALAELPPPPAAPDLGPLESRLDALEQGVTRAEAAAAAAGEAVAALPPPPTVPADPAPRLDALEARIGALEAVPPGSSGPAGGDPGALAALRAEIAALRAQPTGAGDPAALSALQAEVAALKEQLAAPSGPVQAALGEVQAASAAAAAAIEAARAEAEALREAARAEAQAGRLQGALGRIRAALEAGTPFATATAELLEAGIDPGPALTEAAAQGLPTLTALREAFPAAARSALEASLRADMGDTALDRIGAFLRTQTGARSLTPREGTDPDAVLSRAEAALAEGRLSDALAETGALPEAGRAALADWRARAERRLAAEAALTALSVTLGGG